MPLAGYGSKMVAEAEKNGIDWRLAAAISVRESSGGKYRCGENPFGWGSCRGDNFASLDEAIEVVSLNLGGNNPRTAYFYAGKSTKDKLESYNPPSIAPNYADEVIAIMEQIAEFAPK